MEWVMWARRARGSDLDYKSESTFTGRGVEGGGPVRQLSGTATVLSTNQRRVCPVCPNMVIPAPGESGCWWWVPPAFWAAHASWEIGYCWLLSMKCSLAAACSVQSMPRGNCYLPSAEASCPVSGWPCSWFSAVKVWKSLKKNFAWNLWIECPWLLSGQTSNWPFKFGCDDIWFKKRHHKILDVPPTTTIKIY